MSLLEKKIIAVLGPTNTGKTHFAIERMLQFGSGIIGFPLRLLAREVYEKCIQKVGAEKVALITGEEKIIPPYADYFLCTVESMPLDYLKKDFLNFLILVIKKFLDFLVERQLSLFLLMKFMPLQNLLEDKEVERQLLWDL